MNEHNEIPNYQDELLQLNELLERLHGWENLNIIKFKFQFKFRKFLTCQFYIDKVQRND